MKALVSLAIGLGIAGSLASGVQAQTEDQYLAQAEAQRLPKTTERPERHVVLMPVVGVWSHSFTDRRYTSKVGPVWGMDVLIDPVRWLNVRGGVLRGNQPLAITPGALSSDISVYQPTLEVLRMHLRLEPTYHFSESLSLYAGLGMGWARMTAPAPTTQSSLRSVQRNSVYLGYEGALGVQFEPIVDWMMIDWSLAGSYLANQSGTAYGEAQAFTADGHRTELSALSKFGMSYRMSLGIGIIL